MPENSTNSRIKAPLSIQTLVAVLVPAIIMSASPHIDPDRHPFGYYFRIIWIGVCLAGFLSILLNTLRKAGSLKWGTDTLVVRSRRVSGKEIKTICIDGPLVGILPQGKWIVPVNLCFRFMGDREQAMKRLINWAEANGIQLKYKRFVKWL
ncbi:hypothetical protein [Paenibacillus borealis]|uniref:Uncharacterized protein n=1 Tax=Paenibacillus borealis TaxID=160799 RepID=A0A089LD61_PAEBO|nr:hypothetical protein [Paenibacillus borealis]AIQ58025.1 hypothetical protein PBOR_14620 [Paenibacillus borealis]